MKINITRFLRFVGREVKPVVDTAADAADLTPMQVVDKIPWALFDQELVKKGVPQDAAAEFVAAARDFALREAARL